MVGAGNGGSGGSGAGGSGGTGGTRDASSNVDASAGGDTGTVADARDGAPDVSVGGDSQAGADANVEAGRDVAAERGDATSDITVSDTSAAADGPDSSGVDAMDAERIDDAGDGATPGPKVCARACAVSGDCPVVGLDQPLCNTETHHCVTCIHDVACVAKNSQWTVTHCASDGDCSTDVFSFGDYCVDVEGVGRCAFDASKIGTFVCLGTVDSYTVKKFATDDMVMVCADASQTCDAARGTCVSPCTTTCTPAAGGNVCNATTHRCECGSNTDCGGSAPVCNLAIHQCECGSVSDCPGADGGSAIVCD
jgi:hypothetical protein